MGLICSSETNKASPTEERPSLACCKEGDEEVPSKISCSSETYCCKAETNSETCDLVKSIEGNTNSLMYVPFRSRKLEIIPAKVVTESEPSHLVIGNDQKVQGFPGGVSSQRRKTNNIPRMASASSLSNPVTPFKKFFSKASARPGNFSPQKVVVKAPKSEDLTNHHFGSEYPHSAQPSPVSTPRYKNKNHRRKTNQLSRTLHPNSSSQGLRRSSLNNAVEVYMDSARSGSSGRLCDSDLEVRRGDDWAAQLPCHLKLVRSSSCQTVPDEVADFSHSRSLKSGSGSPDSNCLLTMQHLEVSGSGPESVTEAAVTQYLQERPQFLDQYLMEHVDLETLERWMIRRSQRDKLRQTNGAIDASLSNSKIVRKTSLSRWKFCVHADKRKMLTELTASLQSRPSKRRALLELSHCIASATNADGCNLYLLNEADASVLELCTDQSNGEAGSEEAKWSTQVESGGYLCAWVASSRQSERVSCPVNDPRFPNGTPANQDECEHLLCVPVVQSGGTLEGVMEFYRGPNGDPFYEEDEEIVNSYLVWGAIALHYSELYKNMLQQKTLNDFMLSVVKSIFQDMVSMDNLILKVMNFAQTLVNADRASLFLLDSKSKHLYARIFDVGCAADDCDQAKATEEIRFPVGTGIAGMVAQTGEVLNIPDAYADARFNRSVDQQTGYHTKNILCMPIYIRGNVIGVMQMVNKNTGTFTKEDEESFEMFAVYCGLALHHAKLYDKIRRSEQKYKVALEVLGYHNSCTDDDIVELQSEEACLDVALDDFYFSSLEINDLDKVRHTIFMFVDLFGLSRFEKESLIRFTLTIKKNYRRVPYHNWSHGFSVCNAMYAIIKHNPTVFKPLECLSLFIGALCHDLDHRGKNNKFMLETESPLAAIYTTSTLERHHFNQTITILQQEGHNIFSKLTSTEYKQVLSNIKHCILATDLALFFPTKAKLSRLVDDNAFDWNNLEHRLLLEAITMTACDLCASTKPWDVQVETVKVIFEEFYEQGDAEKAAGKTPMAMMDREKVSEQPMSQVGFLKGICIPCYELLLKLVPMSRPMLDGCQANYERWQHIADTTKKKLEEARAKVKEIEAQQ